jgi:hypothetical protein
MTMSKSSTEAAESNWQLPTESVSAVVIWVGVWQPAVSSAATSMSFLFMMNLSCCSKSEGPTDLRKAYRIVLRIL